MENYHQNEPVITGIGVTSAIGQGKTAFTEALLQGRNVFDIMQRPGRQKGTSFIGAEIQKLNCIESFPKRILRTVSFSGQVAMVTLHEAWEEAKLDIIDPRRIGLVIGGSNLQHRDLTLTHEKYKDRAHFLPPNYGFSFMDTDICGLCTEQFGIHGLSYTIGGSSASGQMAILQAVQAILTDQVDVCIAMGALMDISYWECQALRSLGVMGSDRYADDPLKSCRPFDKNRDGFIYGESCGAVVIERANFAVKRNVKPYAGIAGCAIVTDGNRNPNPSYDGEVRVIQKALKQARLSAQEIDYINPHGTGSVIGDEIELKAIHDCGLSHAYINATKSITGHGLSAAGAVELIATLLQMKESQLHPTRNLEEPLDHSFNWVRYQSVTHVMRHALTLSMGFGGINTAICLRKYDVNVYGERR